MKVTVNINELYEIIKDFHDKGLDLITVTAYEKEEDIPAYISLEAWSKNNPDCSYEDFVDLITEIE